MAWGLGPSYQWGWRYQSHWDPQPAFWLQRTQLQKHSQNDVSKNGRIRTSESLSFHKSNEKTSKECQQHLFQNSVN